MKKLPIFITLYTFASIVVGGCSCSMTTSIDYTVSFKNYDGSLLGETTVKKGQDAVYNGPTPTRGETTEYTYSFTGWDQPLTNITSDCVRVAQYSEELKPTPKCTVTFKNYDGAILQEAIVEPGGTAIFSGTTPTRPEDEINTYTFTGWDLPLTNITTDCIRVARYSETAKPVTHYYTVTFKNYDDTVLTTDRVQEGHNATYRGATPTRPETDDYSYTFKGWDGSLDNINNDCVRVAQFNEIAKPNRYTVTFKNYDGSVLYETVVVDGGTATYGGQTPTRAANFEFTYTFTGWDKPLTNITSNCVRVAQYSEEYIEYTVSFYNEDTLLYVDTVHYQEPAYYRGVTPTKASTDTHHYTFAGWNKDFSCVTESMTIKALFSEQGDGRHIIVNPNNGEDSSVLDVTFDEEYDLGTPSFPGFVFLGWYAGETAIPTSGTWQYSGVSSVIAKWQNLCYIFTENEDGTYTVSLNDQGKAATELVIPSYFEGITVTALGADFLRENTKIEKITIPGTITEIPDYSFYNCSKLKEVILKDGLVKIGSNAFYASGLTSLYIPSTCTTIGSWAFAHCYSLISVFLPRSVTTMGIYAFNNLGSNCYICMEHDSVPNTWDDSWSTGTNYLNCTKLVEGEDFNYAVRSNYGNLSVVMLRLSNATSQLQNYTIPSEIEGISAIQIGRYLFKDNKYIRSIDLTGVTRIFYEAFSGASNLHTVTFSDSLTAIDGSAFDSCSSLKRIEIPNTVTEIGNFAFYGCSSVTFVYIPKTTVKIGNYAFSSCSKATIYTNAHNALEGWSDTWNPYQPVFYDYVSTGELEDFNYVVQSYLGEQYVTISSLKDSAKAKKNLVIPDEIDGISNIRLKANLFATLTTLESINLGNGIKTIPSTCFKDCTNLKTVVLGNNVTNINNQAFYNCNKLSSINLPNTLNTISTYAFAYCSSLGKIEIPLSVSTIGNNAFVYSGRTVFLIRASVDQPNWDSSWYGNTTSSKTFIYDYVSSGVIGDFNYVKSSNGVTDTIYIIGLADGSTNVNLVVPDAIEGINNIKIASYAFDGNTLIKSVDLGHSVTAVNGYAFRGNTSLASVIIPASCTVIRNYAFQSCKSTCVLKCEADSQPTTFETNWNYSSCQVVWGYTR